MSLQAMTWAIDKELPAMQKIVLMMMAYQYDEIEGVSCISQSMLARNCGMAKRTVIRQIEILKQLDLVATISEKNDGNISAVNKYRLSFDTVNKRQVCTHIAANATLGEIEKWIRLESEAVAVLPVLVSTYGQYLKMIWKWGDGEGGYILEEVKRLMIDSGLIMERTPQTSGYTKKKISSKTKEDVYVKDNYTCVLCGSNRGLTVDHIHPEKHGGTLDLSNLQTLCKSCNSKKGSKITIIEMAEIQ